MKKYDNQSDEDLVLLIQKSKDVLIFGVLYDRYEQLVFNKCYGFVLSIDEAKDLTHDVFIHIFIKLSTFKRKSKFSTWLYSITYNFCVNYTNRDKERNISKQSTPVEEEFDLSVEVSDESLYEMKTEKLEQALKLISPEDKMILQLKYQDDVSIKELQEVLELSESAVKMRLSRAKSKLAELYNTIDV